MIRRNRLYRTRDGHTVRITSTQMPGRDHKVAGLVKLETGLESVETWTKDGFHFVGKLKHALDLMYEVDE